MANIDPIPTPDGIQATPKDPTIDLLLTSLTGRDRITMIGQHRCALCGQPAEQFNDELSLREYTISGLCQACQDTAFAPPEDC